MLHVLAGRILPASRTSTASTIPRPSRWRAEPSSPPTGARLMPATSAAFTSTSRTESSTVRMGSSAGTGPDLAELTNGNIVVVWADTVNSSDGNEDIRGQIISADGDKIGGEFSVTNQSGSQWTPAVAAARGQRFFVVWEDLQATATALPSRGRCSPPAASNRARLSLSIPRPRTTRRLRRSRPLPTAMRS